MTTPMDQGSVLQPADVEAPVWQPPMPESEPIPAANNAEPGAPTVAAAVHTTRRAPVRRANSVTVLLLVSAMVAIGGVAFAVGRASSTGQTGTGQTTNGLGNQNGLPALGPNGSGDLNFAPGARNGFGGRIDDGAATVTGTVVSVTSTSITVQLPDGQTVTLATGSSTTYHTQTAASSGDVTAGAAVTIKTSVAAAASASPGTGTTRTATDVTITSR